MKILELTIERYDEVLALMRRTPGIGINDADSPANIARYLARNPGLSFVAEENGEIVGCAFSGHDGRRGYLQHVAVDPRYRRQGVANALISRCLDGLAAIGIVKTHLAVYKNNEIGNGYWTRRGWQRRDDLTWYSMNRSSNPNA